MNLHAVEQERNEATENVKSLWEAVLLLLRSPDFNEDEKIEPKTVKDAECQLSGLATCSNQADMKREPQISFFQYSSLSHWAPSMEIPMLVYLHIS